MQNMDWTQNWTRKFFPEKNNVQNILPFHSKAKNSIFYLNIFKNIYAIYIPYIAFNVFTKFFFG